MLAPVTEAQFGETALTALLLEGCPPLARLRRRAGGRHRARHRLRHDRHGHGRARCVRPRQPRRPPRLPALARAAPPTAAAPASAARLVPALSPALRGGIEVPGDHQVDNRALLGALVRACRAAGVAFVDGTRGRRSPGSRARPGGRPPPRTRRRRPGGRDGPARHRRPRGAGLPPVRPVKGHILRLGPAGRTHGRAAPAADPHRPRPRARALRVPGAAPRRLGGRRGHRRGARRRHRGAGGRGARAALRRPGHRPRRRRARAARGRHRAPARPRRTTRRASAGPGSTGSWPPSATTATASCWRRSPPPPSSTWWAAGRWRRSSRRWRRHERARRCASTASRSRLRPAPPSPTSWPSSPTRTTPRAWRSPSTAASSRARSGPRTPARARLPGRGGERRRRRLSDRCAARRAVPESTDAHGLPAPAPPRSCSPAAGTKGSFEVGVLQYLVGVEGIVPDIITATSAGAIAATVLAQARTLPEFAHRVARDRGRRAGLDAARARLRQAGVARRARRHALGREIHQEITEGTRPPFPLTPATVLAGNEVVPPAGSSNRRGAAPGPAGPTAAPAPPRRAWSPGPASGCPGSGASCAPAAAPSSTSTRWPTRSATAARTGSAPVDPALVAPARASSSAWPSPRCAPASCATSPRTAPSSSPTPAPPPRGPRRDRSTSSTAPSPRPACPWSSRPTPWPTTTTSTAG